MELSFELNREFGESYEKGAEVYDLEFVDHGEDLVQDFFEAFGDALGPDEVQLEVGDFLSWRRSTSNILRKSLR